MKKSIKSVLAKSLAVAMAFSLAGIAPGTSADAAAKKPSITKKVTVTVGKTKTVKVTSKKKVKKTTWSLNKKGKKVVSLSKKKAKSVKVKGKKAGKATLTAKIKVGKKTYKKTCKITVKKKDTGKKTATPTKQPGTSTPTASTGTGGTASPSAQSTTAPTPQPVGEFMDGDTKMTVDESATYNIVLSALNETTFTSDDKRSDGETNTETKAYNRDGSVSFTSKGDYNSGVSYYINPCTSEEDVVDISETRGDGFYGYLNGTKDMSAYDYIRLEVTSENEMNLRTYNGNQQIISAGFPGSSTSETYEGGWKHTVSDDIWGEKAHECGNTVKPEYIKRTVFIPIADLIGKNVDPSTLTAIAFCPQSGGVEVTIHRVDFVKVDYAKKVTGITVNAKTQIDVGRTATCEAAITPDDATRKIVKWTSDNEDVATVSFQGVVTAKAAGTATITATATDGSDVSGSIEITVGEPSESNVIQTHKMDLSKVAAATNPDGDAVQTETEIKFAPKGSMTYVNFATYLSENDLALADYDELRVTWEVRNADGEKVSGYGDSADAPTYGKIAYAASANLNGYGNGIDVNYEGEDDTTANTAWLTSPYTGETCTLAIAKTNPTELATVAGFNLQLEKLPDDMYIVITDITLFKDNNVYVDLSKVAAATNPDGDAAQTETEIKFAPKGSMTYVNFATYLSENDLALADFAELRVTWEVRNADGEKVSGYGDSTDAPTYGKIAYAASANLNGYGNGIDVNYEGEDDTTANTAWLTSPYTGETCTLAIAKTNPTELATVAGFNLQLEKLPDDMYIVITGITLVK